jgi:GNAT superfamily N-acetyltransferase
MTPGSGDLRSRQQGAVSFMHVCVDHPDATRLLDLFYREQVDRYGYAESVDLDPVTYAEPNGTFVLVYVGGRPVGCGACRWYDREAGTVEIKKTYLLPGERGMGAGRKLIGHLEAFAAGWGAQRIVLETGIKNQAALSLFRGMGFEPMGRYVAERDPAINRAFFKDLKSVFPSARGAS